MADPGQQECVRRIGHAVVTMSRHTPWESQCLVQAIAAKMMLRRRGVSSTLYLGVMKDDATGLSAHAWVRSSDVVEDLARAVQRVPFQRWQEAWALARALQAERRFATALRVYAPGGATLADRLGVPRRVLFLELVHAIERAPASVGVTELIESDWRQRWAVLKRWLWPYDDLLTDLDRGQIPNVPTWVQRRQRRRSRYGKFYRWRCCQAFLFLRMWPGALRLLRASNKSDVRQTISSPWSDDR